MMRMTMAEKVLARTSGRDSVSAGEYVTAAVDRVMAHEAWTLCALRLLKLGIHRVFDPEKVIVILDHYFPAPTEQMARGHAMADLAGLTSIGPCARNVHGRPTRYAVTDGSGTRFEIAAEALRRAIDTNVEGLRSPARSLRSSNITVSVSQNTVRIAGRGYGHGAGLCQYGAEARAVDGATHREILTWYYPGAKIVTAYR